MKVIKQAQNQKRGAALVEYGLIIAGVALVAAAAVSIFGTKTAGMIGASAAILPGAHQDDLGAIETGHLIQTENVGGVISVDEKAAADGNNGLGDGLGIDNAQDLVPQPD